MDQKHHARSQASRSRFARQPTEAEQETSAIRERANIVEGQIGETQNQLNRLLDLYVSREFSKEMLIERKTRLEDTLAELQRTKTELNTHLQSTVLSDSQIAELEAFCAEVRAGLDNATFEDKQRYFDLLDVRGKLAVENNEKVAYIMQIRKATSCANANIAFIKYWGNRDAARRVPLNDSISMNLDHATTTTTVEFDARRNEDQVVLGDAEAHGAVRDRVIAHLDRVRALGHIETKARVESRNSFPTGVGLASSASGFAALSLAATRAVGLELSERELSILARLGSGSACRSIPGGFVEWIAGSSSEDSYAVSIAPPSHWDLRDVIAVVSAEEKYVGSTEGHAAAATSPFLSERVCALPSRFHRVRRAVLAKDLALLGPALEEDAVELHFVAMTSRPPIYYWMPGMVRVIQAMQRWRADGLAVYFTLDAGPNVHLICESKDADQVAALARAVPDVQQVIVNAPGGAAHLIEEHQF